jgi:hypothetical protein
MIEKAVLVASVYTVRKPTNFYPLYNGANDQVDRVSAIRSVGFQKVIPRYRLSTSETRDLGTGPDIESETYTVYRRLPTQSITRASASPLPPDSGQVIDTFA